MTSTSDPTREPGYRGALPPRQDRLARPWILIVIGIFVLIIVLSILGVPSRFITEPTPLPLPSSAPVSSESAEPSASAPASAEASASLEPSASTDASATVEPSPSE